MKEKNIEEISIKLGENDSENWELIKKANGNYLWVHLTSFPSGHAIIESENPSKNVIIEAANFCKENTKYRNLSNLKITTTLCKNLKKGNKIGEVFFIKNKNIKEFVL